MTANNLDYRFKTTTETEMAKQGIYTAATMIAEDFYQTLPENNSFIIRWESIGNVHGVECFVTRRVRRAKDGKSVEILSVVPNAKGEFYRVMSYNLNQNSHIRTFRRADGKGF